MEESPVKTSIRKSIDQLTKSPIELDDDEAKDIRGKKTHWGYHLLLDISDCNKSIDDERVVEAFIKDLIAALDMTAIGEPLIVKVDDEEGRGLSAVQIITQSTITFHGDDDNNCVYLDVFSCKPYKPETAVKLVKRYFAPEHIGQMFVLRDAGRYPEK